jgi:hypothetical protein
MGSFRHWRWAFRCFGQCRYPDFLLSAEDTDAILTGETLDGKKIRVTDSVRVVNE